MTAKRYNLAWVLTRRKRLDDEWRVAGMCRDMGTYVYFFPIHIESGTCKVLHLSA